MNFHVPYTKGIIKWIIPFKALESAVFPCVIAEEYDAQGS